MNHNQPIISYYPPDDTKFIDPLYVPYQRVAVPIKGGNDCFLSVNTWKRHGCLELDYPERLRSGMNQDFLRTYLTDPCPEGWTPTRDGFCARSYSQSHESNFFTDKALSPQQYHNGYTIDSKDHISRAKLEKHVSDTSLNRSINPHTGRYVVYHESKPHPLSKKYGISPTRHSYLAI